MHTPSLHDALPALPFAVGPGIDELSRLKPIGLDQFADRQETGLISYAEFVQMSLGTDSLYREMAEHWLRDVLLVLVSATNANRVIAILPAGLVTDHLVPIKL